MSGGYYRSHDGRIVHRATCTRRGKTSVEWRYAARFDNDHGAVLREVATLPWLSVCGHCMKDADS